jgi:hypothetical protein
MFILAAYLSKKLSFMIVQICSADSACRDLDLRGGVSPVTSVKAQIAISQYQNIIFSNLRNVDFHNRKCFGFRVSLRSQSPSFGVGERLVLTAVLSSSWANLQFGACLRHWFCLMPWQVPKLLW